MKLATYKNDSRDGQLMLVSRDLKMRHTEEPQTQVEKHVQDKGDGV